MATDAVAARDELVARGVEVGEVYHYEDGVRLPGPDPARGIYQTFADFRDPDGNAGSSRRSRARPERPRRTQIARCT